jgi:CRP-like cAMP-binding protein
VTGHWRRGSLLDLLPEAVREAFLTAGSRRPFGRGEELLRQGDPPDAGAMVIIAGRVKIVGSHGNRGRVLAFCGPGDIVGELGALSGEPRVAAAVAVEPGEGVWIGARALAAVLRSHPGAREALLAVLVAKLREATARRIEFDSLDAFRRVVVCLLEECAYRGRDSADRATVMLTQPQLAELAGVSIQSVQNAVMKLRNHPDRVIAGKDQHGQITILRMDVLRGLSAPE